MPSPIATRAGSAVQTRSPQPSTDAWVSRILSEVEPRVVTAWNGQQAFTHGRALAASERLDIAAAVAELDARIASALTVATAKDSARKLSTMGVSRDASEDAYVDALIDALPGTPDAALHEATRRILAGEEAGISRDFQPTTAVLVSLARRVTEGWRLRRDRLAAMLTMPERPADPDEPTFSPDVMAKRRAMMARLEAAAVRSLTARPAPPGMSAGARVAEDLKRRKAAGEMGERA